MYVAQLLKVPNQTLGRACLTLTLTLVETSDRL
jgi:hypothetical protein